MNDLTVIQATQGLVAYLKEVKKNCHESKSISIAIAYDHRASPQHDLSSKRFAQLAACVCAFAEVEAHLFRGFTCTPLVPFMVKHKAMDAGIVVTASHNPKQDNGFKVYWSTGSQIVPPHDVNIKNSIDANLKPWAKYEPDSIEANPMCKDPTQQITSLYFESITKALCRYPSLNGKSDLKIAYTAMHGVGERFIRRAFKDFNLPPFVAVKQQGSPDPTFPTVAFPNPEEKGALDLALKTAKENGCSLVLANDPDADRLAAAELDANNDTIHSFTGQMTTKTSISHHSVSSSLSDGWIDGLVLVLR